MGHHGRSEVRFDRAGLSPPGPGVHVPVQMQADEAREARPAWAATPVAARLAVVGRLRGLVATNATRLAEAVRTSRRNPLAEALAGEVLPLADACRFLEQEADRLLRPRRLGGRG